MSTKLIRSLHNITSRAQGGVVTIGNFDGVHVGHQRLLAEVVANAKTLGVPSLVITFEPHPFEFFSGDKLTIPRITRLREKFSEIATYGVENVLILPFNHELAEISASSFVANILFALLRPKMVLVGDDFRFGYKRQGDFAMLQSFGAKLGIEVKAMPTVLVGNERVSSTRVRKALAEGDQALAAQLLGRPYSMMGRVSHGDKLGRQLGFRTANIFLHRKLTPVKGVYAVLVHGLSNEPLPGAANIGTRPTVDGTQTLLEVHLLNFNQDIYGRYVRVEFCEKLREEIRYETLDLLKEQIAKDVIATEHYFQK